MKSLVIYLTLILGAVVICVLVIDRNDNDRPADAVDQTQSAHKTADTQPAPEIIPTQKAVPQKGYYSGVLGLEGEALKVGLHQLIRRHRVLTYGELWDALTDLDATGEGDANVMLIYTRVARAASLHGGDHGEWNREHLWPRAYGIARSSPANSDLHHIRASDVKVNADRGHLYFDETEGDPSLGNRYSADADSWEPPREVKGDVARALFYMAVRYEGNAPNEADLELAETPDISKRSHGKLSVLLEWHRLDPVSAEEKARNAKVFRNYQGNRNPFIDHPEFALRVFSRP